LSKEECNKSNNCPLISENPGECPFFERIVKMEINQKWLMKLVALDIVASLGVTALLKIIGL